MPLFNRLLLIVLIISVFKVNAQYSLNLEPGLIYTLPHKKYIERGNGLKVRYKNPVSNRIGIQVNKYIDESFFYGLGFSVEDYDFGLNNSSYISGGNFSFGPTSSGAFNIISRLGVNLGYDYGFSKRSSLIFTIQPSIGYYFMNNYALDTANFNDFVWSNFNSIPIPVITEEIIQREGFHFMTNLSIGYNYKAGKKIGIGFTTMYQQGFGYFIKYRQRLYRGGSGQDIVVDNYLNGTSLQFLFNFNYRIDVKKREKYLLN